MAGYRSFTALWLGGAGDLVAAHPDGRTGVWYSQPQSGVDYPLVSPSADIQNLFADFYLSYKDQGYLTPFHISWLYGFGTLPVTDEDLPTPTHPRDVIVRDATNTVVFDSTTVDESGYTSRAWSPRLAITRWVSQDGVVCSIIHHTAWGPTDDPLPRSYPTHLFPESAVLQDPTSYQLTRRVDAITAILDTLSGGNISLRGGYNMAVTVDTPVPAAGGRRTTIVTFDATRGGGDGVYPDCEPAATPIRTINTVPPTPIGQFFLNAVGCYYARQPYRLVTTSPRALLPEVQLSPGSTIDEDLPADNAGTTTEASGWPASRQYAHLQLGNDCGACCDCDDYVEVAEYLQKQHARYSRIATLLTSTRDTYHSNRNRWLAAKDCLQQLPVRVVLQAQRCPYADVGVQVCNQTDTCMTNVLIEVVVRTIPVGGIAVVQLGYTFITEPSVTGSVQRVVTRRGSTDTEVLEDGVKISTTIDQLTPAGSSILRFRIGFEGCGEADPDSSYQVSASVVAYVDSVPLNSIPATAIAALNCPAVLVTPADQCIDC